MPLRGCGMCSSSSSRPKRRRSSARSIDSGGVPIIGTPLRLQIERQIQRRLPAKLHDHALRPLAIHHRKHVFQRERLEIKPVGSVVVGGDGLRIAIHHDGFVAVFAQRKRGMAAAIIEFDSLPDAVGPAPENGDFRPLAGVGLVFFFVCGIKIRREGLKFGGAGIHALENRPHAQFMPPFPHRC